MRTFSTKHFFKDFFVSGEIKNWRYYSIFWHIQNKYYFPLIHNLNEAGQVYHLHIPKTGGTYIGQLESTSNPVISPVISLGHSYIISSYKVAKNPIYQVPGYEKLTHPRITKANLNNGFVFCTVRNIFDWLVSCYIHSGGEESKYLNKQHYDYEIAQKGFDYFVKTIANRESCWPNKKFIFCQVFDNKGNIAVDWINRTRTLDTDLKDLSDFKTLVYNKKEKQRVGQKKDYRTYYDTDLIELVAKTWSREMDLYGFSFEENLDNGIINRKVNRKQKENINYNYNVDSLQLGELKKNN